MTGEAEKQKAIKALFPSIAGVLEGEDSGRGSGRGRWEGPSGAERG